MIKVQVRRSARSRITSLTVTGHALYDEHGRDIVCAGVSALVQLIPVAMHKLIHARIAYIHQKGRMWVRVPALEHEDDEMKAAFLLEAVVCALREMEKSYESLITITEKRRDNHV